MANQLHIHEQNSVSHRLQIDSIKAERDAALHDKETIKHELETVKSRLDSVQKAWQNTRGELEQREHKYSSHELHLKQLENDALYAKSCFEAFKQQVGQLLSDGYVKVEPKEDEIKEKIQLLMQSSKDRGDRKLIFNSLKSKRSYSYLYCLNKIITNLQNQKEQLSKQIHEQIEMNKESLIKNDIILKHIYLN